MNISDSQLDLASLFSQISQLEEEQNLRRKNITWLKHYLDLLRQEFDTRPELQLIESMQQAIAQLTMQVAELQQRLNQSPGLNHSLDNSGDTTDAPRSEAKFDDAEVVKQFFEQVEQQQYQQALETETEQVEKIDKLTEQKRHFTALNDEEFKVERILWLLDRIYAAVEESQKMLISAEEFWRRYKAGERDFSGINLVGVNLSKSTLADGVNLSKANLMKANLTGVNWSKVNLCGANLTGVDISEADL